MKILLVCGSLEHGRNGVGDYTRRLAVQLKKQGQQVRVLSLSDLPRDDSAHDLEMLTELQSADGESVECLRLPASLTWNRRVALTKEWLANFPPDWASLQFVPFAYHTKGICFRLGRHLRNAIGQAKLHLMFHELWLGLDENPPIKHRVWGQLQRHATKKMHDDLRPALVTTQADPYVQTLRRQGIHASVLPLFGNISPAPGDAWRDTLVPALSDLGMNNPKRENFYLAGVFGAVYPGWDLTRAVRTVAPIAERAGARLVIVFFGKNDLGESAIEQMRRDMVGRAAILSLGVKSPEGISRILNTLDLGLSTSPLYLIEKSGTYAAMREHGLPVLAVRDGAKPRYTKTLQPDGVYSCREFEQLEGPPTRPTKAPTAKDVAAQLLRQLG